MIIPLIRRKGNSSLYGGVGQIEKLNPRPVFRLAISALIY